MRLWTLSPMQRSPSLGTYKNTNNMPLNIEIPHISKTRNYKDKMIGSNFQIREGGYFLSQIDEKKDNYHDLASNSHLVEPSGWSTKVNPSSLSLSLILSDNSHCF